MSFINKLDSYICEKSVKKDVLIYDNIISIATNPDIWKRNNEEVIEKALKDEIRKGSKNSDYNQEVSFIKQNILPNIEDEMEMHADEFADIFKSLIKAFKEKNLDIFENTLDNYTI